MSPRPRRDAGRDASARRALHRKRRRRRIRMGIAWGTLALVGLGAGAAVRIGTGAGVTWLRENTDLLVVRSVDVGPTRTLASWDVANASGVIPGDDLLGTDTGEVEERLEAHPRIRRARVSRRWNGHLHIDIEEREPVALLRGDALWEVDVYGVVLGPAPGGKDPWVDSGAEPHPRGLDLPLLTGLQSAGESAGTRLRHEGVRRALALMARLDLYECPSRLWVSEIDVSDPDALVVFSMEGGLPIRVGDGRVSQRKIRALLAALDTIRNDSISVRYLDLRFQDMVVVKKG